MLIPVVSIGQVSQPASGANRAAQQQQHLIGEVTATDQTTGQLTVKTDAGASVIVTADERTIYRRLPPGQTSIEKAESITRADVRVGDRVLVPGGAASVQTPARQVIVMAREAIAARRAEEREDWRARGANGRVVSIDTAQRRLTVEARSRDGAETLTVNVPENVRLRRYAPGSLRPADAVASSFADIRVGDQVRILGNREGSRIAAEEIISGRVARLSGVVETVDASRRELTIKDNRAGRTMTVTLVANSTLRRIPPEFAEGLRQRGEGRRAAGEQRGQRREGATQDGQSGERRRAGGRGLQGMLDNLPAITIAELKKGDAVIVTGTSETDDARVTAATLITGDAELMQRLQRFQRGGGRDGNMSPGLPSGVAGGGTGGDPEP
jgi:hypothetical protein